MGGSLARAATVALATLCLAAPEAASAATHALDLAHDAASVFTTHAPDRALGAGAAAAGDVNGDGNPDLVIGAPGSGRNGRKGSGSAYVLFGKPPFAPRMPLDPLGERGFRIDGAPPELKARLDDVSPGDGPGPLTDRAGEPVAGVGDVNGDGLDDVAIAATGASPRKRAEAGAVYVVFGKRSSEPVDLAHLGGGGFRIDGAKKGMNAGFVTAAAGDVNGDGLSDIPVGAYFATGPRGSVYVVFGRAAPARVDLAHLGKDGIAIRGPWTTGPSVAAVGDQNGDGLDDVLVGASPVTEASDGHAYVVFGRAASGEVRLGALGRAGYSIRDSDARDFGGNFGGLVGGPGDVNGDGRPDILVGGGDVTHVVFSNGSGKSFDVAHATARSIRIRADEIDQVAPGSGDANFDGLADLLLGTAYARERCRGLAGTVVVVYGRRTPGRLRLSNLAAGGYAIDGAAAGDEAGSAVGWLPDVGGDGGSDVLVGAPRAGRHGRAYVVTRHASAVPQPRGRCARR